MSKEERNEYMRVYREANREKQREYMKAYNQANREKIRANRKEWCQANREKIRARQTEYRQAHLKEQHNYELKSKYGITFEQKQQMYVVQGGVCAICRNKFTHKKYIHVDHNHVTGQIRELLCRRCNGIIGFSREDITILSNAIAYLTKWNNIKDNTIDSLSATK